jgi:GTP-binding protein Era
VRRKTARIERAAAASFRCGQVAIVGRPSVGKSTLLNALIGARIAITSRRPQTTRGRVRGILTTRSAQFVFVDTPGFQTRHRSLLNERMNRAVRDSLADIDVVVAVVEARGLTDADRALFGLLRANVPAIAAVNKIDRVADKARLLPVLARIAAARDFAAIIPVSAEKAMELDVLLEEIEKHLPESPALFDRDDLTDRDERFLAAEFLREKIFRQLGEEVPYAAAVAIDAFRHEGDLRRIHATVYVHKAGQRAILLGEHGARRHGAPVRRQGISGGMGAREAWLGKRRAHARAPRLLRGTLAP